MQERDISNALAAREDGECEIQTPAGFIDVLTPTVLYEVKAVQDWKAALGQVLAYARYYPSHTPALYLYGTCTAARRRLIREHCAALKVRVVWHDDAALPAPRPRAVKPPPADGMALLLACHDSRYGARANCTIPLHQPPDGMVPAALEAYLDAAHGLLSDMLDNALTTTLRYAKDGVVTTLRRQRPGLLGAPVCCQLVVTLRTSIGLTGRVSLPGIRDRLPSGACLSKRFDYARSPIPELQRFYALLLDPACGWQNDTGARATSIARAAWVSYGMVKTRTGHRIAR